MLESADLAQGNLSTLRALTDPEKRPLLPRDPPPPGLLARMPDSPFQLDEDKLAQNIRKARRGAAPGPSGMTNEHLFTLLESEDDLSLFSQFAGILARADIPPNALEVIRRGQMSALRKANGGVRGIVVGDTLRRLVARTIAQQIGDAVERATSPFQYALKTRAGCECVSHMFQTLLDLDPRATILSVDGVGAFDLISRNAMKAGLSHLEEGDKLLPFVRLFYSSPSTFLWEDDVGTVHHIPQGEGGEQGDPLMPLLVALGQHTALLEVSDRLDEGERLVAFLDDLCALSGPDRTVDCHNILAEELWEHARIRLNQGKTCVFNKGGEVPDGIQVLQTVAERVDPEARVWRGDHQSDPGRRGITILGTPVGTREFVLNELESKACEHATFLRRIPAIQDLQCAWVLLLYCGVARANFFLRTISPDLSHSFATLHDNQIWECFCSLVGVDSTTVHWSSRETASLPLAAGGLGLRSAVNLRHAAHWASWADSMKMITESHPEVARIILRASPGRGGSPGRLARWSHDACTPSERHSPVVNRHFSDPRVDPRFNPVRELASGSGLQN